ncbi:hypothetical protein [Sediminivirga luteola]|uniref:Toxin-antitoxin system protein n=1 Tax=Sediminivirga luteola TaxID=1774748 RepID=A0A8J2U060_9MICO|nr:hypothetical protein [Sediminivirga luteola]MCI2266757.1 hypothetical protein [Sediminivirga luteola]GGA23363.1 hypothetical protein GCM10011333_27970 [Sediminivirga luteola]
MAITTIKVRRETRDRLKEQAAARHQTLDQYLTSLADQAARQERMQQWSESVRRTSAEDMASWREESAGWDRASGDGL